VVSSPSSLVFRKNNVAVTCEGDSHGEARVTCGMTYSRELELLAVLGPRAPCMQTTCKDRCDRWIWRGVACLQIATMKAPRRSLSVVPDSFFTRVDSQNEVLDLSARAYVVRSDLGC
jgi:hypothetical protein